MIQPLISLACQLGAARTLLLGLAAMRGSIYIQPTKPVNIAVRNLYSARISDDVVSEESLSVCVWVFLHSVSVLSLGVFVSVNHSLNERLVHVRVGS